MPRLGGEEATGQIRTTPKGKYIPIIALTAHAMSGNKERYLNAGMDGYVSKPINRLELFDEIERVIREKERA